MANTPLRPDQVGTEYGLLLGPVGDLGEIFAVGHVDRDEVTRRFAQTAAKFEDPRADGYPADHVGAVNHLWALLDRHRQTCDEPRVIDDETVRDDDMDCVATGWCGEVEYWVWSVPADTPGAIALTRARRHDTNLPHHHGHTTPRCPTCGDPLPRITATGDPMFPGA